MEHSCIVTHHIFKYCRTVNVKTKKVVVTGGVKVVTAQPSKKPAAETTSQTNQEDDQNKVS